MTVPPGDGKRKRLGPIKRHRVILQYLRAVVSLVLAVAALVTAIHS